MKFPGWNKYVAIQIKLLYLCEAYCNKIIENNNARVAQLVRASV